jgi:hypothetical protein
VPPIKQYVNVDPTNAVERPYGVDRKRVGRKIKLTAKLANKDEGVYIGFSLTGPKHDEWGPTAGNTPEERRKNAELRLALAGVNGVACVAAMAQTDKNGEASVELFVSGVGGDKHQAKAFIVSGHDVGTEVLSEEYESWRRIYVAPGVLGAANKATGRKGAFTEVAPVSLADLAKRFKDEYFIEVEESRAVVPVSRRHRNVIDTGDPPSLDSGLVGMYGAIEAFMVNAFEMVHSAEKRERICMRVSDKPFTLKLANDLLIDESLPDPQDWWVENATAKCDGQAVVVGTDYFDTKGPRSVEFAVDRLVKEASLKLGAKLRLEIKYKSPETRVGGLCDKLGGRQVWVASHRMHGADRAPDARVRTFVHEVGHALGMVPEGQPTRYEGRGHTGPHCWTGMAWISRQFRDYSGFDGTCIMFGESGDDDEKDFCGECSKSLLHVPARFDGRRI